MKTDVNNRKKLRELMAAHFSPSELRALCFDLGIDYDEFGEKLGKTDWILAIVNYAVRKNLEDELLAALRQERPDIDWPATLTVRPVPQKPTTAPRQPRVAPNLDVPQDVLEVIFAKAEKQFPKDHATKKYVIDNEIQAWRNVQSFEAPDVPADTLAVILKHAERRFLDDFSTRLSKINREVDAWHKIQDLQAPDVPMEVLSDILEQAEQSFPDDFSTRLSKINREVDAWRSLYV